MKVMWFSAGVSSAVAGKLVCDELDKIIYIHIEDQHPDTLRFVKDCEIWYNRPIEILQSPYKTVAAACRAGGSRFINSPYGANCTKWLKKRVRKEWELDYEKVPLEYFWGMDKDEVKRADRLRESMPEQTHRFPLIEHYLTKEDAHRKLQASGIKRPAMYGLGYLNNNCIGCVKGGMGYWNKIRVDFPEVFTARAKLEREIGGSCINGIYLDELESDRGRQSLPICEDCGIMCELIAL